MGFYSIEYGYRKDRRLLIKIIPLLILLLAAAFFAYSKARDAKPGETLSQVVATVTPEEQLKLNAPIEWPKYGQAAYGVSGSGVLAASKDNEQPVPVASLAKVITALAVMKQKPLAPGEQGAVITLNKQDIANYEEYVRKSGAVVPIEDGEQISQYQMMQAMLMPSANNMADSLARWAFGSDEAYVQYANNMVRELGLSHTTVADASGFSPSTKSTANDMVQLGILYMQNPVLKEIAMQTETKIPFAGLIRNYNAVENKNGIVGLKVGNTDEAGRCFLVANIRKNGSKDVVSVAAIIGADQLEIAMKDARTVLKDGNEGYDKLPAR